MFRTPFHSVVALVVVCVCATAGSQTIRAELVSTSFSGMVQAQTGNQSTDTDLSNSPSASLSATSTDTILALTANTTTGMNYNWNAGALELTADGTVSSSSFPSVLSTHVGAADLDFSFTIDSQTEFTLSGTHQYAGTNATSETQNVGWSLVDSFSNVVFNAAQSSSAIAQNFSESETLAAGTYTFSFDMDYMASFAVLGNGNGNWQINSIQLSPTAVPEPASAVLFASAVVLCAGRRRRA